MDVKSRWIPLHGTKWLMFHGHLDPFPKPLLGGRTNTKPEVHHGILKVHKRRFIIFYQVWEPHMNRNALR